MNDATKIKKETAKMQMMVAHWGTKGLLKRYGEYAKDGTKISYKDTFALCLKMTRKLWGKDLGVVRITCILDGREKEIITDEDIQAEFAKQPEKDKAIRELGKNYRNSRRPPSFKVELYDDSEEICEDEDENEDETVINYTIPAPSQADLWANVT